MPIICDIYVRSMTSKNFYSFGCLGKCSNAWFYYRKAFLHTVFGFLGNFHSIFVKAHDVGLGNGFTEVMCRIYYVIFWSQFSKLRNMKKLSAFSCLENGDFEFLSWFRKFKLKIWILKDIFMPQNPFLLSTIFLETKTSVS